MKTTDPNTNIIQENRISCRSCFVTSQFPGADIDDSQQCKWCRSATTIQPTEAEKSSEELRQLAQEIKAKRKGKYDCIIGVSGGLDSSYVAYISKVVMGLNPLLVNYDHGFFYDAPKKNAGLLAETLGCDIRFDKSNARWDMKYVGAILKAFSKSRLYWGICSSCHYILPAVVKKIAREEDIQFMMSSANEYEAQLHVSTKVKLKAMLRSFLANRIIDMPGVFWNILKAQYYFFRLKIEQYVPPIGNLVRKAPQANIINISLTSFIPWNIKKIRGVLSTELGWQTPQTPNLGMRFDCMIEDSYINHTYKSVTGSTIHAIIANNLIYDNLSTKSELAPIVEHYDRIITDRQQQVKEKILSAGNP